MAKASWKGLPKLKARLEKLREQTRAEVSQTLAEAGDKIVAMMKRQVPVDSGALRDSIGWTFGDAPKYSQRVATGKAGDIRITIFAGNSKVRYAHLVEFGTAPHTVGGEFAGAQHPGTTAQPFFFSSYRALRKEVTRMLRKAIRDAVKKAMA